MRITSNKYYKIILQKWRYHEYFIADIAVMAVLDSLLAKKEDKSNVPSSPNTRKVKSFMEIFKNFVLLVSPSIHFAQSHNL